jgi:hypothetical protein
MRPEPKTTFRTRLTAGSVPPYDTWTFVVVPRDVHAALGGGARIAIRGLIEGVEFRSTMQRGDGVMRFPVTRDVRENAGVRTGNEVEVTIEIDPDSREPEVPVELRDVLDSSALWEVFRALAPSCRRAWAEYVAEAKQQSTRARRAAKAVTGIAAKRFPGQR